MVKKVLIYLGSILLITVITYMTYIFYVPGENGKKYVKNIISKSNSTKNPCTWSGFVTHRKTDKFQIFLSCNILSMLQSTEIKSKAELTSSIHTKIINPLLSEFPEKENVYVTFIAQVKEDVVICADINKKRIVSSSYDSYENYCFPQ